MNKRLRGNDGRPYPPPRSGRSCADPTTHDTPLAVSSLPCSLLKTILAFLTLPLDSPTDLLPRGLDCWEYNRRLFTVQQVCHAWHHAAKSLAARYSAQVWLLHEVDVAFHVLHDTPLPPPATNITQLQIVLGNSYPLVSKVFGGPPFWQWSSLCNDLCNVVPTTYWIQVLRSCPALERLDLSRCPFRLDLLEPILDAASTYCLRLTSLVLPICTGDIHNVDAVRPRVLDLLARILPRWRASNGGLLLFSLPLFRCGLFADDQTRQFAVMLAENCPRLRFLRDWTEHPAISSNDPRDNFGAGGFFGVDLDGWQLVCKSLTHLEELYWRLPTSSEQWLQAFASLSRPTLKCLYLDYTGVAPPWFGEEPFVPINVRTLRSLFQATPCLERFALVTTARSRANLDIRTRHDLIVDELLSNCDRLASLRIDIRVGGRDAKVVPMVTDIGIRKIMGSVTLRSVTINPVRISPNAILELLDACMMRQLHDIEISLHPVDQELELMETVLQRLLELSVSVCASLCPRFVLRIQPISVIRHAEATSANLGTLVTRVLNRWRPHHSGIRLSLGGGSIMKFYLAWNFVSEQVATIRRPLRTNKQMHQYEQLQAMDVWASVRRAS